MSSVWNNERPGTIALTSFLRTKRARLQPQDVGLSAFGRRRTQGLRREEVAQLAGISTTLYTWLEQGRRVAVSLDALERVARALRLTEFESKHLISLVKTSQTAASESWSLTIDPAVQRVVESITVGPAIVLDVAWNVLAWNRLKSAIHYYNPGDRPIERNVLWQHFVADPMPSRFPNWEQTSARTVAMFRADYALHAGQPQWEALIAAVSEASPAFRRHWTAHEVAPPLESHSEEIVHPDFGTIRYVVQNFSVPDEPDHTLVVHVPLVEDGSAQRVARALEYAGKKDY